MNHGDVESTRQNEYRLASARAGANDFGRKVAKVVVSQILESVGFQGVRESALDSFTELAIRYICGLGKTASSSANLAGRRECNVFDVIQGLEDLGTSQGASGALDGKDFLAGSGIVKELIDYVSLGDEISYAQPVTCFSVMRNQRIIPSFMQMDETPPGKHIPAWLPAFPDPHTYIHTPMWNERETDPRADKIEQARQRRKAEQSLLSLQQRLASHGSVGTSSLAVLCDRTYESQMAGPNPSPGTPVQVGEKDLSVVDFPTKLSDEATDEGHVSVLEAFAPAIEAVNGGFCDDGDGDGDGDGEKKLVLPMRHAWLIKSGKRPMGESLYLNLKNKGERPVTWIARDDERDDKKRRAEYILRQSMENPQDLMQL